MFEALRVSGSNGLSIIKAIIFPEEISVSLLKEISLYFNFKSCSSFDKSIFNASPVRVIRVPPDKLTSFIIKSPVLK